MTTSALPHPRLALEAAARHNAGDSGGTPGGGVVRVAFVGRTSTEDRQDPTLSLPRQLRACRGVLPEGFVVTAYFYDVESGRKDLADRGRGHGLDQFDIPIPRDGGIQDLLAEAQRPGRRFDVVICEAVDRISRRTYLGTQIEHTLEEAGVPLLASDEPFTITGRGATQTLTRRVKQGISEWYVMETLEKSRGGLEVHSEDGFNIGKPPYGYIAHTIPHPVPAKRADGKTKSRLVPDPDRAATVAAIFEWRVVRRLGYKTIAAELNADLLRYPPPVPTDPGRAVGRWTQSSVYEILHNPKHTGYMAYNRKATKRGGKVNPVSAWIWSPEPTHPPLVSRERFLAAQQVAEQRERSRSSSGANTAHRQTRRMYRFRGYVRCAQCGRRMGGKSRHADNLLYGCHPAGPVPAGHPRSLWISESKLADGIHRFLSIHVFGPDRADLLAQQLGEKDTSAAEERRGQTRRLRRAQDEVTARRKRLLRSLELTDDPDGELTREINTRLIELRTEGDRLASQLAALDTAEEIEPAPALLDALPITPLDLARLPHEHARALFDAFRLEVHFDKRTGTARCQVTLTADSLPALVGATGQLGADQETLTFCSVPPVGVEPTLRPF